MVKEGWSEVEANAKAERLNALEELASALRRMSPDSTGLSLNVAMALDRADDAHQGAFTKWGLNRAVHHWRFR